MSHRVFEAFSNWRGCVFAKHKSVLEWTVNEHEWYKESQQIQSRKDICNNFNNAEIIIRKVKKEVIFNKWIDIVNKNITICQKIETLQAMFYENTIRSSFFKWISRAQKTQHIRNTVIKLQVQRENSLKLKVFQQLKIDYFTHKQFEDKLNWFFKRYNTISKQSAFQLINSFAQSRDCSNLSQKSRALNTIIQWANWVTRRSKGVYFHELIRNTDYVHKQGRGLSKIILKLEFRLKRTFLSRWRQQNELDKFINHQSEEGPKRMQLKSNEQNLHNLVDSAIIKGGYTPQELNEVLHRGEDKIDSYQLRAVTQLIKAWDKTDDYLVPHVFHQWKKWTKMKKLIKYWINYWERRINSSNPEAPLLFRAFNKWKYHFTDRDIKLDQYAYNDIQDIAISTNNYVNNAIKELDTQESAIQELNAQNKILVDNTISGQKLALTICSDNWKKKVASSFQKWQAFNKRSQLEEKEYLLKSNMEIIVNLKLKIKELDLDNQDLVSENEQLRKTSMDGIFL